MNATQVMQNLKTTRSFGEDISYEDYKKLIPFGVINIMRDFMRLPVKVDKWNVNVYDKNGVGKNIASYWNKQEAIKHKGDILFKDPTLDVRVIDFPYTMSKFLDYQRLDLEKIMRQDKAIAINEPPVESYDKMQ